MIKPFVEQKLSYRILYGTLANIVWYIGNVSLNMISSAERYSSDLNAPVSSIGQKEIFRSH